MKKILKIENLDCPVCAEALQSDLQKIKGINEVCVDYVTQTISLDYTDEGAIARVVKKANAFEKVRVLDGAEYTKQGRFAKEWLAILCSAIFLIAGMLLEWVAKGMLGLILGYIAYAVAYFTVGIPVLVSTVKSVGKGRVFNENFLMTIATFGAVALGEYSEAVLVILLYQLGELLQSIAVGSSRNSVKSLLGLKSERATVLKNGEQISVNPEEVCVGDTILVKAGEKIPVDCVLQSEKMLLDTKSLTGEPKLRSCQKGDEILSGCINAGGVCELKAIRPYENSAVGKILDMVENASAGKAKPEKFIAKFAKYYTPIVCGLALLLAVAGPLLSGFILDGAFYFKDIRRWVQSALTFLVVSCPCALVISVPLCYFMGIGACAKRGILVKGAVYLDILSKTKTVALDKTGTLTLGEFSVCAIHTEEGVTEEELLSIVCGAERNSTHPIANAFENFENAYEIKNAEEIAGQGLVGWLDGEKVLVGNEKLLETSGISFAKRESIHTLVYTAKGGKYLGCIEVGDRIRKESKPTVCALKKQGVERVVVLTGDARLQAEKVANEVGVDEVNAELLPLQKLEKAEEYKKFGSLLYVGDGINDAPVMMASDCAVSMGKLGSETAIETSDIVLIFDDLTALPTAIKISRRTRKIVFQNVLFSIAMKVCFMVLGAIGWLPLWLAVFSDVGVMLLAVVNSFRVKLKKEG